MKIRKLVKEHLDLYEKEMPIQTKEMLLFLYERYYKTEKILCMVLSQVGRVSISSETTAFVDADNDRFNIGVTKNYENQDTVVELVKE